MFMLTISLSHQKSIAQSFNANFAQICISDSRHPNLTHMSHCLESVSDYMKRPISSLPFHQEEGCAPQMEHAAAAVAKAWLFGHH